MYAKIQISGDILVKTGMHIGGSGAFAAIGAVDSPVVKDVKTNLPMIPGSSLKGKMRSLLAKEFNEQITEPKGDHERISRLFGSSEKNKIKRSRILFSDMVLANEQELREAGLQSMTEVKFENSISRLTAVANPRQIERAVRGSVFGLDLIYEMENEQEFIEDMQTLAEGMKLLQYDYLGGSGSRGYGKIQFNNVHAEGGTVIKSSLTIDETECNLKIEDILDAVKLFYEQYYQVFQSKFPRCDRGKPNTVFLGGGSGFVSKTVVYPMFGEREGIEITKDIFDRTGVPQDHKHYKDTRMRVSPHILKCTRYQGKEYMMGQCEIDIS